MGAWIEIPYQLDTICFNCTSHPLWVRGLKYKTVRYMDGSRESHPLWVRGLKLLSQSFPLPFLMRRTLYGCVD